MLGAVYGATQVLFDPSTLTWTTTGTGKADAVSEEGWTLLPSGKVLTVDTNSGTQSELYDPSTGAWSLAGSTGQFLPGTLPGDVSEMGPSVLMPDGRVFQVGGNSNTAVYNTDGTWVGGPGLPNVSEGQLEGGDSPAALLPNGHVLIAPGPGLWSKGVHAYDFDGANLVEVARPANASGDLAYWQRMLPLPTGEVMLTDGSSNVQIYQSGASPKAAWAPTIQGINGNGVLARGASYFVSGTQFNGLSQAVAYGDDAQMATNYPLVRVTNNATGHVAYLRTHDHSSMGVATGSQLVWTQFDVPASAETGAGSLQVVANGIASAPFSVTVK